MTINVVVILWKKTPQEKRFAFESNISKHLMNISKISFITSLWSR